MNSPSLLQWILLTTPLLLAGCRTSQGVTPIGGTVGPDGSGQGALVVQGQGTYDAPPHQFSPRPHPPRVRSNPPPPNLAALPKMVDRIDKCYGVQRAPVATSRKPVQKVQGGTSSGTFGSKHVPYQPGGNAPQSPPSPTKASSASSAPSGGMDGGGGMVGSGYGRGSGVGGASKGEASPRPASQPNRDTASRAPAMEPAGMGPPPPQAAPPQEVRAEAKKKRQDRNRAADERSAMAPADEAEMAMDDADNSVAYPVQQLDDPRDQYQDWGSAIYLSNDDTMSLSSAQRVMFAIDKFLPLPLEHIRPHELLNYFSFQTEPVAPQDDFSVLADVAADPKQPGIYNLALAVRGRPVDLASRRNANVSFVVDRSGSMTEEGRMDYLKRGMNQMTSQLKTGDVVHIVLFDHEECTPLENFVVGRDKPETLRRAIDLMRPRGATDVNLGLERGYAIADAAYQPTYNNRVILVTDALTNTGNTDPRSMATVSKFYDSRKIRLSGVGVGRTFNDALLDKLTERGKGAYVFLGSEAEVDAVFGSRFISLLETTAMDVHFQLHLPPSLRMNVFYGEESSVVKEDVQAIHYFANTSQLFLSDLMARGGNLREQDQIMLTIEYEDPEDGRKMVEERAFTLGDIVREDAFNVRKGRLLIGWADRLALLASRQPGSHRHGPGTWEDPQAWETCENGRQELGSLAAGLQDPEAERVMKLWDKYCARYEQPRNPVRRDPVAAPDSWPGARN